jgi:hypothetical protein
MTRRNTALALALGTILLAPAATASSLPAILDVADLADLANGDTPLLPGPDGGSTVKNVFEAVVFLLQQTMDRIMGGLPNGSGGRMP